MKRILVTGGAGFIGSALCRYLVGTHDLQVVNVDKLTYAANLSSLNTISGSENYFFEKADICDGPLLRNIFNKYKPDGVIHLAAETHVDRSIDSPDNFINSNIIGTYNLLEITREYLGNSDMERQKSFRFLHVSTDEVYGSLGETGYFTEETPYAPNSPYSASKASSDHLVRAYQSTYALPLLISNCSNNYGPYQFPEKLIPLMIINILNGKSLPVYGDGLNRRDWLYVNDHVKALFEILSRGTPGERYNVGGGSEKSNIDVVQTICMLMDDLAGDKILSQQSSSDLISFVTDRPGHDYRYAIDASKIEGELGWEPEYDFDKGIYETVLWYLDNVSWWQAILDNTYQQQRLGLSTNRSN